MNRVLTALRLTVLCTLYFLLQGCATSSLFTSYPDQAAVFKQAIVAPTADPIAAPAAKTALDNVLAELNEERESADAMLYMMERGRLLQLNNMYPDSKADFNLVISKFEEKDLASTVEVSDVAAQGSSLLVNENVIPYKGAGYERIFTHHHQAFNYLGEKDIDGASVEFRKVALEQQILLEQHEKEVAEAYEEADANNIDVSTLSNEFAGLDTVAGKVKSSFQNAYTFYTSAAFWEASGEYNSALVDYKKALEINSDSDLIKQDIARVSKKLGDRPARKDLNEPKANEGVVVVFFEDGFVPAKSEIKIPLPTFDGGLISLAFPYYDTSLWPVSQPLKAMDDNFKELAVSETVVDVGVLAVKDLKEQIPALLVRQALRAAAKYQLQKESAKQLGIAGQLAASAYNIISESADRRSWLTLPHTGQVMRFNLSEGDQEVRFSTPLTETAVPLTIKAKRTTFVRVVNVNNQLITQVYAL
ncbi:MAG: hypothetical protein H7A01_12595 [Hahellaceae bacterium]|nr:hypothetical protein [Hahellaceae bacterium]MCP5209843.1 hypothetical protein [Hahellaceae bacterium]